MLVTWIDELVHLVSQPKPFSSIYRAQLIFHEFIIYFDKLIWIVYYLKFIAYHIFLKYITNYFYLSILPLISFLFFEAALIS
jgi:hypothetical protein